MRKLRGTTCNLLGRRPSKKRPIPALNLTLMEAFDRHRRLYAVLLALSAAGLVLWSSTEAPVPHRTVLVAARELSLGTELSAQDLKEISLPEPVAAQLQGLYSEPTELLGRRLIIPLITDAPITRSAVLGSLLVENIPAGMQAVTIQPQDKLGAQLIPPGTTVEVIHGASFADGRTEPSVLSSEAVVLFNGYLQGADMQEGWPALTPQQGEDRAIIIAVPDTAARDVVSAAAAGNVLLSLTG